MIKHFLRASLLCSLSLITVKSYSQEKKESKIQIRVEKEVDGKKQIIEKNIDATNLSPKERDAAIQQFQDSVMNASKGQQRIRIEVDDNAERRVERREDNYDDEDIVIRRSPRVKTYRRNNNEPFDSQEFMKEFQWKTEGLRDDLKSIGRDMKYEFRTFDAGDIFSSSKTIKGLDAYPNKPNTEILNIRFNAPQKGDVLIKVLDVKGNTVAKDEIKDFSGDYIGQIKLNKQLKGTFFVMVSQGEDGTMKRLILE